jgi:6-phosphogluconolactonase
MDIRRFAEREVMMAEAAAVLSGTLAQSSSTPFAVMLSGGQTPIAAYQRLAALRAPVSPQAHVFFSDERFVPTSSPESNYGRIRPFLAAIRLPDERIFKVPTDTDLATAADQYDATLREFIEHGGRLPLGFLGVGADGHTASLFTSADLERGRGRCAVAVPRPAKPDRVSVTPSLLCRADRIIFLVAGADKTDIAERMIRDPANVIAARAVEKAKRVEIWLCGGK